MKSVQRRSYHHGDLRNALLKAALELVHERRSTHFSLRDLCERVDVTQPAVYRHFADLDDLLSTLCRDGFDAFAEIERRMMSRETDPWASTHALIRAYIHFATSNPSYFRIMFDSGFANRPENIARAKATFQVLVDTVEELRGPGEASFDRAIAIWAAMHGLSALMLSGQLGGVLRNRDRVARLEESLVEVIERSLERPEPPSSAGAHS